MKILQLGFLLLSIAASLSSAAFGFGSNDKVLLKDISTLTLYHGRMTNGRRSSPVPQLKCVGGTGSGSFVPQVVQCYNRGTDGQDVQWECKTDMDNAYRFGKVEVTCEGYEYPDDPYVLKGSCGLEYTLDLTQEGYQQKQHGGHDYYGNQGYQHQHHHNSYDYGSRSYQNSYSKKAGSVVGDLIFLGVIAVVIYVIYKTCISSNSGHTTTNDYDHRNRFGSERRQPPPPGFRDEYTQGDSCSSTYNGGYTNTGTSSNTGTGGGGFWTGAFTGGLLGYMFGNRNNYGSQTYHSPYNSWGGRWNNGWGGWGTGWGNSWGGGGNTYTTPRYSSGSSFSGSSSHSSGTRTASGFGGTKRR